MGQRERVTEAKAGEAKGSCGEGWGAWECWEQLWFQESVSVTAKCGRGLDTPDSKREAWKVLSDVSAEEGCLGSYGRQESLFGWEVTWLWSDPVLP